MTVWFRAFHYQRSAINGKEPRSRCSGEQGDEIDLGFPGDMSLQSPPPGGLERRGQFQAGHNGVQIICGGTGGGQDAPRQAGRA